MKLALGTVQFGVDYGVANRTGRVTQSEAAAILAAAREAGIGTIDTAVAYGDSETRLGELGVEGFEVVSKLPANVRPESISTHVSESLARLRVERLDALLLHRSADLVGPDGSAVYAALEDLRGSGRVRKIGVSIYHPEELEPLLNHYTLDLVQAPYSIVDRRLSSSGWLDTLKKAKIEVHARSAFLQGLLLMPPSERPAYFARWSPLLAHWDNWLEESGQTALEGALRFALGEPSIDRVVVGVDSLRQLKDILAVSSDDGPLPPSDLACDDPGLVDPSCWRVSR